MPVDTVGTDDRLRAGSRGDETRPGSAHDAWRVVLSEAASLVDETSRGAAERGRALGEFRRALDELRRAHDRLEARVAERTAELARANEKLRDEALERARVEQARTALQRQLATLQEDERRRIARDLHDQTGQLLASLSLAVQAVGADGALPARSHGRLAEVQRVSDELGRQVHEMAVRLRPTALDDLGLPGALGQLVADWSARTGVGADLQVTGLEVERLPAEVETALYRVVQEALTNVAKHAHARQVSVTLGRLGLEATLVVEDDGRGFAPDRVDPGRLGLLGMTERVTLAGGRLDVESSPGAGTTVIARLPADDRAGPADA
ncbi:MAG: sensor histidine kinase [Myxococcales bacterium]|nr:MAG: sensor histidine kinase [Myxococcales bacterium]